MNRLEGLIAATYTPFDADGEVHPAAVAPMVERLLEEGVTGFFTCGTTGEGMLLSTAERRRVTEAFVAAAAGRVPVVAHVGHESIAEARSLAVHAAEVGVTAVSATCPSYYGIADVATLVDVASAIAAATPELPLYYYHIPVLTGVDLDMVEFLERAGERIPNLVGLKYTKPTLHEFQACRALDGGRFDVLWGCDEMLLGALATGARGAIGSTYNVAAPLYGRLVESFVAGDLDEARRLQECSVQLVRTIARYPFHAAMKQVLAFLGDEVGRCRLPLPALPESRVEPLRENLTKLGFFEWSGGVATAPSQGSRS